LDSQPHGGSAALSFNFLFELNFCRPIQPPLGLLGDIKVLSHFQNFCKENPRNNEEFRPAVERMIMAKEKTRERFLDRNNRDNSN
jgi:hypothetical protein